jgi:hypothetical protein
MLAANVIAVQLRASPWCIAPSGCLNSQRDDALWFCAALHDFLDRGACFSGEASLTQRESPFS